MADVGKDDIDGDEVTADGNEEAAIDCDADDTTLDQDGLVLFKGLETGVNILSAGNIQRRGGAGRVIRARLRKSLESRNGKDTIITRNGLLKSDVDLEPSGGEQSGTDSDGDVGNNDGDLTADEFAISDLEEVNTSISYTMVDSCYLFQKCGQFFDIESKVLHHWAPCKVHGVSTKVVDRACSFLDRLIDIN